MSLPSAPSSAGARLSTDWAGQDWGSLGLVLAIVGSFLLASSILSRHPREMVSAYFGGPQRLRPIREYIFHRVQLNLGFAYLLAGFVLQLVARSAPPAVEPGFPVLGVGLALVGAALLIAAGWWWSHRLFRSYLREHLLAHPPDFENEPALAREVGELFGVGTSGVDTVQSYAHRLRARLGLPGPGRTPSERLHAEDEPGEEDTGVDVFARSGGAAFASGQRSGASGPAKPQ
jgi:hypothetical protein